MKPLPVGTVREDTYRGLGVKVVNEAVTLAFAVMVPFLLLGLVLWLARLEETLTDGLESVKATRDPAPVAGVKTPASAA